MELEYIEVKNPIVIKSGYDHVEIKPGFYLKNVFKSNYPYFDLNNDMFFGSKTIQTLEPGSKVMYDYSIYTVIGLVENSLYYFPKDKSVEYGISKLDNVTMKSKHVIFVYENKFKHCPEYYFINSEGDVSKAVLGKKPHADEFRKQIGNMYNTIVECRTALKTLKKNNYESFENNSRPVQD